MFERLGASHAALVTEHTKVSALLRFILPVSIATLFAALAGAVIGMLR